MTVLDIRKERLAREARFAVASALQAIEAEIAAPGGWLAACERMWGYDKGRKLSCAPSQVVELCAAKLERIGAKLARRHWSYSQSDHLATVALHRAAQNRVAKFGQTP